jgi:hypothetical protein
MSNLNSPENAPYGIDAIATDATALSAPASNTDVDPVGRTFIVLTDGVVSVTTVAGSTVTFTAKAGMHPPLAITEVLAATTADLLIFQL